MGCDGVGSQRDRRILRLGGSGLAPPAVQPGSNLELLAGHMIDLRDTVGKTVAETNTSVRNLANELGAFTNYQEGVNEEQGLVNRHTDERVCDLETRTAEQGNVLGHTKVRMSKLETRMFLAKKSNRANATRISSVEGVVTSVGQFLAESHGYQPRTNGEEAE